MGLSVSYPKLNSGPIKSPLKSSRLKFPCPRGFIHKTGPSARVINQSGVPTPKELAGTWDFQCCNLKSPGKTRRSWSSSSRLAGYRINHYQRNHKFCKNSKKVSGISILPWTDTSCTQTHRHTHTPTPPPHTSSYPWHAIPYEEEFNQKQVFLWWKIFTNWLRLLILKTWELEFSHRHFPTVRQIFSTWISQR